jgi:hypothetical protein
MQEIDLIFNRDLSWGPPTVFAKAFDKFVELYKDNPEIKFTHFESLKLKREALGEGVMDNDQLSIYNPCLMTIKSRYTGKFYLVTYCDQVKDLFLFPSRTIDLNLMRGLITSIGCVFSDIDFEPISFLKYIPIGYVPLNPNAEDAIEKYQTVEKTIPEKMRFRNFPNDPFRAYIMTDDRFEGVDKRDNLLMVDEYMRELASHKINLSLNGHAEVCHRDMEIMGLGNVLLRTKFVCQFHEPLIPDYHYVAVDVENFRDYKSIADKLINKYNEIKDKHDFLNFVGKNAREWYLRNGCTDGNANLLTKIVDLNKLK